MKTESAAARAVRIPILLFTGFLALYLTTAPGRISGTDAWTRYLVAVGLVEYGQPVLPPSYLLGYGQFQGLGLGIWTWGPKYLLPLMPLIAVAWAEALARWGALLRPTRFALAGLIAVSVAVQILSASVSPLRTASLAMAAGVAGDPDIVWRPEWSPLLNQGANVINAVRHLRPGTPLESLAGPVEPERRLARDLGLNTFDWWWMRAWHKGVTGIWIAPLVLAAIAAGSVWRLWRLTAGPARR